MKFIFLSILALCTLSCNIHEIAGGEQSISNEFKNVLGKPRVNLNLYDAPLSSVTTNSTTSLKIIAKIENGTFVNTANIIVGHNNLSTPDAPLINILSSDQVEIIIFATGGMTILSGNEGFIDINFQPASYLSDNGENIIHQFQTVRIFQ